MSGHNPDCMDPAAGHHTDGCPAIAPAALDLEAIEARAKAATPGPWTVKGDNRQAFAKSGMVANCAAQWADDDDEEGLEEDHERGMANARFIAHARADVPALVAEVRRLKEAVAEALTPFAELIGKNDRLRHERDAARVEAALLRDVAQETLRYLMTGSLVDAGIADKENRPRVIDALVRAGLLPPREPKPEEPKT